MELKIEGNPGTGNTFQEIKIGYVENYVPNATTVINNHYGDSKKVQPRVEPQQSDAVLSMRRSEILEYVGRIKPFVADAWKERYNATWQALLELPAVAAVIFETGKQKDTSFNRNLVANLIYIMCDHGIITESNAAKLAEILEGDKDHSVRAQLRKEPTDAVLVREVKKLIQ